MKLSKRSSSSVWNQQISKPASPSAGEICRLMNAAKHVSLRVHYEAIGLELIPLFITAWAREGALGVVWQGWFWYCVIVGAKRLLLRPHGRNTTRK